MGWGKNICDGNVSEGPYTPLITIGYRSLLFLTSREDVGHEDSESRVLDFCYKFSGLGGIVGRVSSLPQVMHSVPIERRKFTIRCK